MFTLKGHLSLSDPEMSQAMVDVDAKVGAALLLDPVASVIGLIPGWWQHNQMMSFACHVT